jgi:hypothetical protein
MVQPAYAVLPAALSCEVGVHPQSSVTLYGIADISLRYLSNANTVGDGRFLMGPGGINESRRGTKGVETLSAGWSTYFELENRFFLNGGQSDPTMPFFNEAHIGLESSRYGKIVVGRQYNVMIEGITRGGYSSYPWIPYDFGFQPEVTMTGGIWLTTRSSTTAGSRTFASRRRIRSEVYPGRRLWQPARRGSGLCARKRGCPRSAGRSRKPATRSTAAMQKNC